MQSFALLAAVTVTVATLTTPAFAQAPAPSGAKAPVLATVNGDEITQADVDLFYQALPPQMKQIPIEQVQPQILDRLVDQKMIAQEARKTGMHNRPDVMQRLAYEQVKILNEFYLEQELDKAANDSKVREAYNKSIALEKKREEINARHILVKTKAEADTIIAALKGGADFIKLAKERSTGPSGKNGGDLGFFTAEQMVPPFSKAAFALQKGQITDQPVQTQFGWHVIKLEDRRLAGARAYEEVAPEIREKLITEAYEKILQRLRANAKIDRMGSGTSKLRRVQ